MSLPKAGYVILHTSNGSVHMPRAEALPFEPKPIVEGDVKFLCTRTIARSKRGLFQERLGDDVRFGDGISPTTGEKLPGSLSLFIREDHEYHSMMPDDFLKKYGWF